MSLVELLAPLTDPFTISEIVHDAVGSDHALVNPHNFVGEFMRRRLRDSNIVGTIAVPAPPEHSAYAMSLKQQRSQGGSSSSKSGGADGSGAGDKGFTPVVNKKKQTKTKREDARSAGAPVGVGGRTVVGAAGMRNER
jgi:hypothetical protein